MNPFELIFIYVVKIGLRLFFLPDYPVDPALLITYLLIYDSTFKFKIYWQKKMAEALK